MKKKKILVVEDDKFLRKIYQYRLSQEGFEVLIAKNGEEGLDKILHERPDLVLLDIAMPKINGFDVLEAVRSNTEIKDTKVIILSNLGQDEDIKQGTKLGVLDYLVKSNTNLNDAIKLIKKYLK